MTKRPNDPDDDDTILDDEDEDLERGGADAPDDERDNAGGDEKVDEKAEVEGEEVDDERLEDPAERERARESADDDLPDDPRALKAIIREQQRQRESRPASSGTPTTPAGTPDPRDKELEDAFAELAKGGNRHVQVILGRLTEEVIAQRQEREAERALDTKLDEMRVPPNIRGIVRRVAQDRRLDAEVAYLVTVGGLTLHAQRARSNGKHEQKDGGRRPPIIGDPAARRAGRDEKPTSSKPVRDLRAAARSGGSSGSLVSYDGFKMRPKYTADEYEKLVSRLSTTSPRAAQALARAHREGKVTVS